MAEFEYKAQDREGRSVTGRVDAVDIEQAVAKLLEQGLSARAEDVLLLVGGEEVDDAILIADDVDHKASDAGQAGNGVSRQGTHADPKSFILAEVVDESPAPRLSARETTQLVETVVDLASSNLRLSAGLRATAQEVPQRRVATAMRRLAAELDRGVSLDVALGTASQHVPDHLRGLILAGLRTGRVAHVLEELVAMDRDRVDLRRRIVAALAYPTILFVLLLASFVLASLFIVRPFSQVFNEFGVELPALTLMMINTMNWFDHSGATTLIILLGIVVPSFVVLLFIPKPPELQRACYRLPIVGPLWRWQSLVDFSRLMHLLLDRRVPIAEALRLTAAGLRWSDLAEVSRACAVDVEKGMGLSESMAKYADFPASIHPVIGSGMQTQQPAEAFAAAADMYQRRAGVDATQWEAILPPMILVFVAVGLGLLVLAMFLPLIKLISSLT